MPEGEAATRGGLRPGEGVAYLRTVPAAARGSQTLTRPVDLEFNLAPLFLFFFLGGGGGGGGGGTTTPSLRPVAAISRSVLKTREPPVPMHAPPPVSQGTAVAAGHTWFLRSQSVCFNQLFC